MRVSRRSFLDLEGADPLQPFVGFALLTLCAFAAHPQDSNWRYVALTVGILAAGAAILVLGARRSADWKTLAAAIAAVAAIAALRHSQGGSTSGYSPLAMLAVVWVAVMLGERALLLINACTGLMFALPLAFVGAPMYPSQGWRGAILFTLVALVVGAVVNRATTHMRVQARDAQRRTEDLEYLQRSFGAIANVARDVALGTEARELICNTALTSLDARMATVVEPRERGFAITGSAGVPLDRAEIRRVEPVASLQAYHSAQRVFVPDARRDPRVSPAILDATGAVSIVFEPIVRDGKSVGVLAVAWSSQRLTIDAKTDAILNFLAAEAAAAIERADLLAQLDGLAHSDPLTGLANRRTWNAAIATALRAEPPLCVAMIDLDHFKKYNDEHGHAAGDRLLKACAAAWRSHLRVEDTLARIGGEEFAVLLPGCSLTDALEVLERLREATPSAATASVGVAEIQPNETAEDVLARADAALYNAKTAGRNRMLSAA